MVSAAAPECCTATGLTGRLDVAASARAAEMARALADPVRAQVFDLVRRHDAEVCQCELQPLFELSQPTLSHHIGRLTSAGLLNVERRGKWAYSSINATSLEEIRSWLS